MAQTFPLYVPPPPNILQMLIPTFLLFHTSFSSAPLCTLSPPPASTSPSMSAMVILRIGVPIVTEKDASIHWIHTPSELRKYNKNCVNEKESM